MITESMLGSEMQVIDQSMIDFLEEHDESNSETTSDKNGPVCNEDFDADFDLAGAFGLDEDDPFLVLEDALFTEMCGASRLSGA
jgi:U3 small nucleolar ribonucleoprotein component